MLKKAVDAQGSSIVPAVGSYRMSSYQICTMFNGQVDEQQEEAWDFHGGVPATRFNRLVGIFWDCYDWNLFVNSKALLRLHRTWDVILRTNAWTWSVQLATWHINVFDSWLWRWALTSMASMAEKPSYSENEAPAFCWSKSWRKSSWTCTMLYVTGVLFLLGYLSTLLLFWNYLNIACPMFSKRRWRELSRCRDDRGLASFRADLAGSEPRVAGAVDGIASDVRAELVSEVMLRRVADLTLGLCQRLRAGEGVIENAMLRRHFYIFLGPFTFFFRSVYIRSCQDIYVLELAADIQVMAVVGVVVAIWGPTSYVLAGCKVCVSLAWFRLFPRCFPTFSPFANWHKLLMSEICFFLPRRLLFRERISLQVVSLGNLGSPSSLVSHALHCMCNLHCAAASWQWHCLSMFKSLTATVTVLSLCHYFSK